ncbi:MAG: hypothetical protein K2I35_06125 [Duncaniella sp.]|nr:hypothetical protein [Duncaniella sp.]
MTEERTVKSKRLKSVFLSVAVGINVLIALMTVFSAYGGAVNPDKMVVASIVAMMLPGFMIAGILLFVADLVFWRKLALVQVAAWVAAAPPLINFSPLNLSERKLTTIEKQRTFTFLTYNVLHFWDFRGDVPGLERNQTLDYILSTLSLILV